MSRNKYFRNNVFALLGLLCAVFASGSLLAQNYGPTITLEQARTALAAAEAEARSQNWPVAIAIVDTAGGLVAFSKLDNTQNASVVIAQDKARSAALFKRPTKVFEDALAGGGVGLRFLTLQGAITVNGGIPLMVDGAIIGAIGVSGVTSEQDGVVAAAGVAALQ